MKRCLTQLPFVLVVVGTLAGQTGGGAGSLSVQPATQLPFNKAIDRELAGGDTHEYSLVLKAGDYARITIEQRTINVTVTIVASGGREVYAADNEGIGGLEDAEVIADRAGEYRVRVLPVERSAPLGKYALLLRQTRRATGFDMIRVEAARVFAAGMSHFRNGTHEAMLEAVRQFDNARERWHAARDPIEESRTFCAIAASYVVVGDRQKALNAVERARPLAESSADSRAIARVLDSTAEVHNYFGEKKKAIELYEQALPLWREAHDRAAEAKTLSNLGVAYSGSGQRRTALDLYQQSVAIFREMQDRRMLAEVDGNIGVAYDNLGEYDRALQHHLEELAVLREISDRGSEAIAQNNIGSVYSGLGEYQKALDAYNAALEINRELGNRWNAALNLNNIAWVYANLGDRRRALDLYEESLAIVRAIKDQRRIATTLNNIANLYAEEGNYAKAIELQNEALPMRCAAADRDGQANSLNNLGDAYAKLGDAAKAREYFERALAIHRVGGNRHMMARTLRNLGALFAKQADAENAMKYLQEAAQVSRDIRDQRGEAAALADIARFERDRGHLEAARRVSEDALALFESVRLTVASPTLRASLFASARDLQELNIDILMRLHLMSPEAGFDAAALLASERTRARSLLEMLRESGVEIRRDVDSGLLDRERQLQRIISTKAEQQVRLLSSKHTREEAIAIAKEMDSLTTDLEQVQSRIRESSPEYASLTKPALLNVKEMQSGVLDRDTVLLEYEVGREKSYLWVVTPSSLNSFELPPRADIELAVKKAYELLTTRNQTSPAAVKSVRVARADAAYPAAAAKVSEMLLAAAAPLLAGKRLLIVADGVLHYLPFAALPEPGQNTPLIVSHEVVTAPSASVVALLRRQKDERAAGTKNLLVFADPVFSAADSRVAREQAAVFRPAVLTNTLRSGTGEYLRLRFSRTEADEIARVAPDAVKAMDFDASRETALSPDVGKYRILHFATHALLNNEHPELSGIVLSLVDAGGQPRNGFLRLYDIYNLRLSAGLVVLSACKTAAGEEISGEGLIGLTRGFFYAGAPRVVATLWDVDDRTSAELMKSFYRAMLVDHQTPAAALRAAQIAMWKSKGWDSPYHWGAFALQGEWQ